MLSTRAPPGRGNDLPQRRLIQQLTAATPATGGETSHMTAWRGDRRRDLCAGYPATPSVNMEVGGRGGDRCGKYLLQILAMVIGISKVVYLTGMGPIGTSEVLKS